MMTTLIVGANGATGRLLVEQLLNQGVKVKIIIRSIERMPKKLINHKLLCITVANLLEMSDSELSEQVKECDSVVSCLGHNLTFKGMFGHPKNLVTQSVKRLCHAIEKYMPIKPVKFILMNTTGNQNKKAGEKISFAHYIVIGLIRLLLPPHADNENAASYLQTKFETNHKYIEWSAIRPDSLINEEIVSQYKIYSSPIRSALFDSGKTSRINVAHFMSLLVTSENYWSQWKSKMPVIYNN